MSVWSLVDVQYSLNKFTSKFRICFIYTCITFCKKKIYYLKLIISANCDEFSILSNDLYKFMLLVESPLGLITENTEKDENLQLST